MIKHTADKYRIVGTGFFHAQVKTWYGWKTIGDGRASIERALAEIKFHQQGSCWSPTQAEIDTAKPETL